MVGAMVGDITATKLVNVLGSSTTLNFSAMAGVILMLVIACVIPKNAPVKKEMEASESHSFNLSPIFF